jgi:hypothetical protein
VHRMEQQTLNQHASVWRRRDTTSKTPAGFSQLPANELKRPVTGAFNQTHDLHRIASRPRPCEFSDTLPAAQRTPSSTLPLGRVAVLGLPSLGACHRDLQGTALIHGTKTHDPPKVSDPVK